MKRKNSKFSAKNYMKLLIVFNLWWTKNSAFEIPFWPHNKTIWINVIAAQPKYRTVFKFVQILKYPSKLFGSIFVPQRKLVNDILNFSNTFNLEKISIRKWKVHKCWEKYQKRNFCTKIYYTWWEFWVCLSLNYSHSKNKENLFWAIKLEYSRPWLFLKIF